MKPYSRYPVPIKWIPEQKKQPRRQGFEAHAHLSNEQRQM
jgi:hypothetical protein